MTVDSSMRGNKLVLSIRGDELVFAVSPEPDIVLPLAEIRAVLGEGRVSGILLEGAIAAVEDLIMPVLREMPPGMQLIAKGSAFARLVGLVPHAGHSAVPLESVEILFNELADHAAGSPVAWRHPEDPGEFALALVLLREVMQHGGFRAVSP